MNPAAKKTAATQIASKQSTAATNGSKTPAKKDAAKGLQDLFEDSLKDIYWAEKALTKAIPKMHKNATDTKLKKALEDHLAQTKEHVTRLEQVFESMGKKATAKKCEAMEGIMKEGDGIVEETQPGSVRDAGIIAAAQKVEHYEIATYGTLAAFAKVLKQDKALQLLLATLQEEKAADELLTGIADTALNTAAMN